MKIGRKQVALLLSLFIFSITVVRVSSDQTKFKESRFIALPPETILDERCLPAISLNGKVGFIASVTTGAVMSFNTTSGRIMSSLVIGDTAGAVSLIETDSRRLLAVATANDPDSDRPVTIAIINASKPKDLQLVTLVILPKTVHITPSTRVYITSDARFGIIASSFPEPTLYSFSLESGHLISQLAIIGRPSGIALQNEGSKHLIAISSAMANTLSFINLDESGILNQISFFSPDNAQLSEANNPVISFNGQIAYIAASEGEVLYSVDTLSGLPINSLKVSPAPQKISLGRNQNREELIAVTLISKDLSKQASGVSIITSLSGKLNLKSTFAPPEQIEFSNVNNVNINPVGTTALIASKSGYLFSFNTESGQLESHQFFGSELLNITVNEVNKKIIIIKRDVNQDQIIILDFDLVREDILDDGNTKISDQRIQSFNPESKESNNPDKTSGQVPAKNINLPKVFIQDKEGNQFAVESSHIQFRSSKTLEIALDGKLTEIIERGSWKFNVRNNIQAVEPTGYPTRSGKSKLDNYDVSRNLNANDTINATLTKEGVQIHIKSKGGFQYRDFALSNPSRIVIDVTGIQPSTFDKKLNLKSSSLNRIRFGQPSTGVVRIVLDLVKKSPYKITRTEDNLVIQII